MFKTAALAKKRKAQYDDWGFVITWEKEKKKKTSVSSSKSHKMKTEKECLSLPFKADGITVDMLALFKGRRA